MLKCRFWKNNFNEIIFVTVVLTVFLCSSFFYLYVPGLGYDESVNPSSAVSYLAENNYSLLKFLHNFRIDMLMHDPYSSADVTFLYFFIFYFFGVSVFVIRFVSIFFGLIFLLFFYFFVRSFFNKRIAMFSLVLLSTLPDLIFYIKTNLDNHFFLVMSFGSLLFFWKFYKKRKLLDLNIGSLFLGLGFSYNLLFWWFFFALIIAFLVLRDGFHFKKKELIVGFIFFLIGASPIILGNLKLPFEDNTIAYALRRTQEHSPIFKIGASYTNPTTDSTSGRVFLRISHVSTLLSSNMFREAKFFPPFNRWLFVVAFIFSLITTGLGIIKKERKKILFILILMVIIFLESLIMGWSSVEYHMLTLIPFCFILSANLLNYLYKYLKILVYFILGIIIFFNLLMLIKDYNGLISGSALSDFPSENIYNLAEYLQKNKIYQPISISKCCGSETLTLNLVLLTSSEVVPVDLIAVVNSNESAFTEELKKKLLVPGNIFMIPNAGKSDRTKFTKDMIKDLNMTMVMNKTFYLRNGDLEYLIFQVK